MLIHRSLLSYQTQNGSVEMSNRKPSENGSHVVGPLGTLCKPTNSAIYCILWSGYNVCDNTAGESNSCIHKEEKVDGHYHTFTGRICMHILNFHILAYQVEQVDWIFFVEIWDFFFFIIESLPFAIPHLRICNLRGQDQAKTHAMPLELGTKLMGSIRAFVGGDSTGLLL